jgi:hypothetical protein
VSRRWKGGAEKLDPPPAESFHEEDCDSRIRHLLAAIEVNPNRSRLVRWK